jgi:hypothetical protein
MSRPRLEVACALSAVLLGAACGGASHGTGSLPGATPSQASASRTNGPSPTPEPFLLAVLRGRYVSGAADRAEWVTVDGRVVASADYLPLPSPRIGNASFVYPPEGWVVAGGLYFIDGHGVVRRLDPSGGVTAIATFPITLPQQLVSFIVRPDGGRLGAIVITLPALKNPLPANPLDGYFQPGAHAYLDLEWANAGGPTTTTLHKDLTADPSVFGLPTLLEGWDQSGPVATLHSIIGNQDGLYGYPMGGDALVHVAEDGTHLDQIGGDCSPADELFDGTIVCSDRTGVTVRSSTGKVLWKTGGTPETMCAAPRLSPGGDQLAGCAPGIVSKDGHAVSFTGVPTMTTGQREVIDVAGWMNERWVVVVDANAQQGLGLVDASSGAYRRVLDSGPAIYVGALPSPA